METQASYHTSVPSRQPQVDPDLAGKIRHITSLARQAGARSALIIRDQEISVHGGNDRILVSSNQPTVIVIVFPVSDVRECDQVVERVYC